MISQIRSLIWRDRVSAGRGVLLAILIIVALGVGGKNLNKLELNQKNQIENLSADEIESFSKELDCLNKELDRLIAEADIELENLRHSPQLTNKIIKSYHDGGHENSWVQDVDEKNGLVLVTTTESKMSIIFKPTADNLQKFNIGWVAPVTFQCSKTKKGKCDFDAPYKLFVLNGPVEVKQLKFTKK